MYLQRSPRSTPASLSISRSRLLVFSPSRRLLLTYVVSRTRTLSDASLSRKIRLSHAQNARIITLSNALILTLGAAIVLGLKKRGPMLKNFLSLCHFVRHSGDVSAMSHINHLVSTSGNKLAYQHLNGLTPGLIFLPGFRSVMNGIKGNALYAYSLRTGRQFTRFDYSGMGQSEGDFTKCNLTVWLQDFLTILDSVTDGKQLLIGSSMGGHLMLLATQARKDRIHGLLGLAAAVDFLPRIFNRISSAERDQLESQGVMYRDTAYGDEPYMFAQQLFDDSMKERNRVMLADALPIHCPVRLIHGKKDNDIPWRWTDQLAAKLRHNPDVNVHYIDDGEHVLSRDKDLEVMFANIEELLQTRKVGYM